MKTNNCGRRFYHDERLRIKEEYLSGLSSCQIGKLHHTNDYTIVRILRKEGVVLRSRVEAGRKSLDFRFWRKIYKNEETGCWEWTRSLTSTGYGSAYHNGKMIGAHVLSYILHTGKEIPENHEICHICDNRKCVNPDHLFVGTHKDNMRDMKSKGRQNLPKGEKASNAKLTKEQAQSIIEMNKQGVSQRELARRHGLNYNTIYALIKGKTWKDLKRG